MLIAIVKRAHVHIKIVGIRGCTLSCAGNIFSREHEEWSDTNPRCHWQFPCETPFETEGFGSSVLMSLPRATCMRTSSTLRRRALRR